MGIEPTSPGLTPGVLSRLNYGTVRESAQTSSADRGCGFIAVLGRVRWASGVIERRHSVPGIEPGPPRFSPKTVRPPLFWWRITDQLRPIEIGVAKRIRTVTSAFTGHYAANYTMTTMKWSLWSDSHRRIRVYETRPVAAEAQGRKWRPRQELHMRPPPSQGGALIYLSY